MASEITYRATKTASKFHRNADFVRGLIGPIGSGKSVACCWEIFSKIQAQEPGPDGIRRSRWAVVRNTYRELQDTTIKTWRDWFPVELGNWKAGELTQTLEVGDVKAEIIFRALDRPDDVKKLLSLELTGAWVNEAREVPRAVVDMLQGRVGRYPSKRDGGPTWYGIIMDTNPPDTDHWWYRLFEEDRPEGWSIFHQPSGVSDEAENVENLPPEYYQRMQAGKDEEWIKVYVHGEYGFVSDGKPVYPEYSDYTHTAPEILEPVKKHIIYVGIDFGLTPAALFAQCINGRWNIIDELVADDMGAVRFGDELGRLLRGKYAGFEFEIWGDPAGEQRSQTNEETPFQILQAKGINAHPAPFPGMDNDFTIRREAVATNLTRLCIDGRPAVQVSPNCRMFRKGMAGAYRYKRVQISGDERYHDKPDKTMYSHVCEAGQYLFVGAGEGDKLVGNENTNWDKPLKQDTSYIV